MARETLIVFVYDTLIGQKENDDPASALIYFHPTWVSTEQKTALCGQIIGTVQCVQNLFCKPEVVSLRNGNFHISEKGRYLFVVGTDRNLAGSHLEFKAKTLYSLLEFLHEDFEELAKIYTEDTLSAKLCSIFDTYIKMLVYARSIFSQSTSLVLTKSSSNVFMDAIHVLDSGRELDNVLGGSMMYHNKVVATHLSSDLTNQLILIDPYRNKCSAEVAETTFSIPVGVQLLQVYISDEEYSKLLESSNKARNIFHQLTDEDVKKNEMKKDEEVQNTFFITAMKRDQSLIFTAVPEDSSVTSEHPYIPTTKKSRPKFLNLKNVCGANNIEVKSKVAASTPICGQTSVCSTPLKDLKKFVYQNPLKICHNDENENKTLNTEKNKSENFDRQLMYLPVNTNLYDSKKYSSFSNMSDICNSIFDKNSIDDYHILPTKYKLKTSFRTITDPTFPVFKPDGTVVSRPYYEERIGPKLFHDINQDLSKKMNLDVKPAITSNGITLPKTNNIPLESTKKERLKNSMELPLKSQNTDSETFDISSTYSHYSSGVPQTPLMAKLSMLPSDEHAEGSQYQRKSSIVHPVLPNQSLKVKANVEGIKCKKQSKLQKCLLFVCGQQNTVLTMLLQKEGVKEDVIKKLWDICTDHLNKLESNLRYSMESYSNLEGEPYTYLRYDSDLHSVKRGGPWNGKDLDSLHYLHDDFSEIDHNLTEIMIRGADNIIFGHQSGSSEVFYSETANFSSGLPPPVDPMGMLQLKARKRLERDHKLILI